MSKVTLKNLASGYGAEATINANNDSVAASIENTISRDGTTPNEMGANLDMNGNRILNLPNAIANQEPVTLAQAGVISGVDNPLTTETVAAVLTTETVADVLDSATIIDLVGNAIYPRTQAEEDAGIAAYTDENTAGDIVNPQYAPGDVRRYGAVANETASSTSSVNTAAIQAALDSNGYVWFQPGVTYMTSTLLPQSDTIIDLNGATIKLLADQPDHFDVFRISPMNHTNYWYNSDHIRQNITIRNGIIDGNRDNQTGHNQYPNSGAVCPRYAMASNPNNITGLDGYPGTGDHGLDGVLISGDCRHIRLESLKIQYCYTDGILTISENGDGVGGSVLIWTDATIPDDIHFVDVDCNSNTRQGFSHVGGTNVNSTRCRFRNTGAFGTLGSTMAATDDTFTVVYDDDPDVDSAGMWQIGKAVYVWLDDGTMHRGGTATAYLITNVVGTTITIDTPLPGGATAAIGNVVGCTHFPLGPQAGVDIEPYTPVTDTRFTDCEFTGNASRGMTVLMAGTGSDRRLLDGLYFTNCKCEGNSRVGTEKYDFTIGTSGQSELKNIHLADCTIDSVMQLVTSSPSRATFDVAASNCSFGGLAIRRVGKPSRVSFTNCQFEKYRESAWTAVVDFGEMDGPEFIFDNCLVRNTAPTLGNVFWSTGGSSFVRLSIIGGHIECSKRAFDFRNGFHQISIDGGTEFVATNSSGSDAFSFYNNTNMAYQVSSIGATYTGGETVLAHNDPRWWQDQIETDGKATCLIGITLDTAAVWWTKVVSVSDSPWEITIEDPLPSAAADGNDTFIHFGDRATQLDGGEPLAEVAMVVDDTSLFHAGDSVVIELDDLSEQVCTIESIDSAVQFTLEAGDALTRAALDNARIWTVDAPIARVGNATFRNWASVANVWGSDDSVVHIKDGDYVDCAAIVNAGTPIDKAIIGGVRRGTGSPVTDGVIPIYVGEIFVDTTAGDAYQAVGLTSADWKQSTP